ncbi:chemokine-like factor [Mixophyes fleayi]|uniref:chemokine-like factor n=1 Tax=Mixophyes fleayi TaxID=3061075 RepID=UPI003F4DE382
MPIADKLDLQYLKSIFGILKILRLVVMSAACVAFGILTGDGFYIFQLALQIVVSAFFFFLYFTKLNRKITFFFWPIIDFMNAVIGAISMAIIGVMAHFSVGDTKICSAVALASVAAFLHIGDALFIFRSVKIN